MNVTCRIGRCESVAPYYDLPILSRADVQDLFGQLSIFDKESVAFAQETLGRLLELASIVSRQSAHHFIHRVLQLLTAFNVIVKNTHAKRAQFRHDLISEYP
jgi:hypothetical protein